MLRKEDRFRVSIMAFGSAVLGGHDAAAAAAAAFATSMIDLPELV